MTLLIQYFDTEIKVPREKYPNEFYVLTLNFLAYEMILHIMLVHSSL